MPAFVSKNTEGVALTRTQSVQLMTTSTGESTRLQKPNFAGIQFTTGDAWTLTDGPTIYIAQNVENIGLFYIQQTALPKMEMDEIMRKITQNNVLQKQIEHLMREVEDKKGKDAEKEKKAERETFSREVKELEGRLQQVKERVESVRLRMEYVPNTVEHLRRFKYESGGGTNGGTNGGIPFAPNISESDVVRIMSLEVDNNKKILLLLGIGMFVLKAPTAYLELIKELAMEQKLYMILASSDYIYGTNYAFCHGVISKDLTEMTPQKTIQAMGRIGRNRVQQDYTVRFRNDELIRALYLPLQGKNKEAVNMCRLFSDSIVSDVRGM
jgi:hypothetical protein